MADDSAALQADDAPVSDPEAGASDSKLLGGVIDDAPAVVTDEPAAEPKADDPTGTPTDPINIVLPGDDASDEDVSAFYRQIGAPESTDGYADVAVPDGQAEELTASQKALALEAQLTPRQLQILMNRNAEGVAQAMEAQNDHLKELRKQNTEILKKDWGADFAANLRISERGRRHLFDADTQKVLEAAGAFEHEGFIRGMLKAGAFFTEDQVHTGARPHKGPNPYKADTLNITKQTQLERENPELAQQLKAAAGKGDGDLI